MLPPWKRLRGAKVTGGWQVKSRCSLRLAGPYATWEAREFRTFAKKVCNGGPQIPNRSSGRRYRRRLLTVPNNAFLAYSANHIGLYEAIVGM